MHLAKHPIRSLIIFWSSLRRDIQNYTGRLPETKRNFGSRSKYHHENFKVDNQNM